MDKPTNYFVTLVGVSYRPAPAKQIVDQLEEGDPLLIEREPTNEYDKWAIKVIAEDTTKEPVGYDGSVHLGYIQRDMAEVIAPFMDAGWHFNVTVRDTMTKRKPILKVEPIEPARAEEREHVGATA